MGVADLAGEFKHEVGGEGVEEALDGLGGDEAGNAIGVGAQNVVMEATEERDSFAGLIESEAVGVETVVEVGSEVGDLVGKVDELGFKGWAFVEEVLG